MEKPAFLVPVDFSAHSQIALDQAISLAIVHGARVTALFIKEDQTAIFRVFRKKQEEQPDEEILSALENLKNKVLEGRKVEISIKVGKGRVYDEIVRVADNGGYQLIVMGTTGSVGIKKKFIGTNALRVVKQANCPVITIKGKVHRNGCKNIVLPLDLTKQTTQKVDRAIELCRIFPNAMIRVVSIWVTPNNKIAAQLTEQLVEVKKHIEERGLLVSAELVKVVHDEDSVASGVVAYSKKVDADIILIMTQQESKPAEFFIGSSAQSIINTSDVPVMSILPD